VVRHKDTLYIIDSKQTNTANSVALYNQYPSFPNLDLNNKNPKVIRSKVDQLIDLEQLLTETDFKSSLDQ
jgi:hypothetical protein